MPSLHLDIPSIDWIERTPRSDKPGRGKASPVREAHTSTAEDGLASPAAGREARDQPWPRGLAGAMS